MDANKLAAVRAYLHDEFPGSTIEEQYDFDRGAQTFKIRAARDVLLLKVGEEFLADNDQAYVRAHLDNWAVASVLRQSKEFGIFVGNSGVKTFRLFV